MDSFEVEAPLVGDQSSGDELVQPAPCTQQGWTIRGSLLLTLGIAAGLLAIASRAGLARTAADRGAVTASIQLSAPAALRHFEFMAPTPCAGEGQEISGEKFDNEEDCAQSCMDTVGCQFIAYCQKGKPGCIGTQENNCVRYSRCDTMDTNYAGYMTRQLIKGPALESFDFYAPEPCVGEGQQLGGERQDSEEKCAATCVDDPQCKYMAFCPSGATGCEGPQENNCVRYSACGSLDANYHGYTTNQRKV